MIVRNICPGCQKSTAPVILGHLTFGLQQVRHGTSAVAPLKVQLPLGQDDGLMHVSAGDDVLFWCIMSKFVSCFFSIWFPSKNKFPLDFYDHSDFFSKSSWFCGINILGDLASLKIASLLVELCIPLLLSFWSYFWVGATWLIHFFLCEPQKIGGSRVDL